MKWGREDQEWAELVEATAEFLAQQAHLRRITTYSEVNAVLQRRTGSRGFDFGSDGDRAAMGALLGEVAVAKHEEVGALVSSIVIYLNDNDAGAGFYRLAVSLGLLSPKANSAEKLAFWADQVERTHKYYAEKPGLSAR
ncbi:hypothetical protein [Barrientosiimonas humi]|uniref:hypothetical protein n=1 Tax=Barrientosiimonas humi TaxID=999931 RepID=UPI00370DABDB